MLRTRDRRQIRRQVKKRIRKKVLGTADRPRVTVFRSLKHIYAQAIDDSTGRTLAAASTLEKTLRGWNVRNVEAARAVGAALAEKLLASGHDRVVFDRAGFLYQGKVQALAAAARQKGLKF
ncbi:MAG: 50S ribosomal protein L18 [Acidobacteriota bacterium]